MLFIIGWDITFNFLSVRGLSKSWHFLFHLMRSNFFLFLCWEGKWWQRCLPPTFLVHFLNEGYILIPFALMAALCVLCHLACGSWYMRWCHAARFIPFNNIFLILFFDFSGARLSFSQGPLTWSSLSWHRMKCPLWWATVSIKTSSRDNVSRLINPLWQGTLFSLLMLPVTVPFIWPVCIWNWMCGWLDID